MKIVTFFYFTVWDSFILIRFGGGGRDRWWKAWHFFIWLFEIPPFWSDLGGRGEVVKIVTFFLSDWLRFLHSDQIWGKGWGDENMTFFYLPWLFEIPPLWSNLGEGLGDENRNPFLSDCLRRFLHPDQIWEGGVRWWKSWPFLSDCLIPPFWSDRREVWGDENRDLFFFIWVFGIPLFWSDLARYCYV